jgi:hypothetical protein
MKVRGESGAIGRALPAKVKCTSALRRVEFSGKLRYVEVAGLEGYVCAFKLARDSATVTVEAVTGRAMQLVPGDIFLGTPGNRESNRILVGGVPKRGLVPGKTYWVLAECGAIGELISGTPRADSFLAQAKYLGAVTGEDGRIMTMRTFAIPAARRLADHGAIVLLIVGTSAEVGKTTAGTTMLQALRKHGYRNVVVLKATGTSAIAEIATYQDYGAAQVFDCVDFGLPTTYPSNRKDMVGVFDRALDTCLSAPADAVLIECGGDMLAANIPTFLKRFKRRRSRAKVILAAPDALGAFGATQQLRKMGLSVDLITGPCTDTSAVLQRTEALCKAPAMNLSRGDD